MLGVVLVSANVEFEDYSVQVKQAIKEKAIAFLHEVGDEIIEQTARNYDSAPRVDKGHTKGSFEKVVDESELSVHIGTNYMNAIWEEFGTGIHAEKGDGRSGYWVYVKGGGKKSKSPKSYTKDEAKRIVAIMRSKGLDAYYTNGKTGKRHFRNAYTSLKSSIIAEAQRRFGGLS